MNLQFGQGLGGAYLCSTWHQLRRLEGSGGVGWSEVDRSLLVALGSQKQLGAGITETSWTHLSKQLDS